MTPGQKLQNDRASRNAAKNALGTRLEQVREDLETRGLGGRIADRVTSNAADAAGEVVDVVRAHKPIVAGTVLALVAWIFRNPLVALFHRATGDDADEESGEGEEEECNA